MNEIQRLHAAKRGDDEALAELLHTYYLFVYKYLLHLTLHQQSAEDLTQDTMVRAIEKIRLYDERRSKFSSWLMTIATRLYFDHRRKNRRERAVSMAPISETDTRQLRWQTESTSGEWLSLMDLLTYLPNDIRVAVILKHYYGYEYSEIAAILEVPVGTAKSRVHNGLRSLRKEWDKGEEEGNASQ